MVTHLKLLHTSIHPKAPVTSAPSDTSRLETLSKQGDIRGLCEDRATGWVSPGHRLSVVLRHKTLVANSVLCWWAGMPVFQSLLTHKAQKKGWPKRLRWTCWLLYTLVSSGSVHSQLRMKSSRPSVVASRHVTLHLVVIAQQAPPFGHRSLTFKLCFCLPSLTSLSWLLLSVFENCQFLRSEQPWELPGASLYLKSRWFWNKPMLVILCLVFEAGTCCVARLRLMVLSWLRVLQCIYTVGSFVQITISAKIFPVFSL